jgi:hypothetical protein
MGRTVYTTRANFLDDIKVFGNVKALYEYAFSSLNTETPFLDRSGSPYPATYSRFNTLLKKQGFVSLYANNSLSVILKSKSIAPLLTVVDMWKIDFEKFLLSATQCAIYIFALITILCLIML